MRGRNKLTDTAGRGERYTRKAAAPPAKPEAAKKDPPRPTPSTTTPRIVGVAVSTATFTRGLPPPGVLIPEAHRIVSSSQYGRLGRMYACLPRPCRIAFHRGHAVPHV